MKSKKKARPGRFLCLLLLIVTASVLVYARYIQANIGDYVALPIEQTAVPSTVVSTPEVTAPVEAEPSPAVEATPEPTPEPEPEYFTLSAIGDLTLITYNWEATSHGYTSIMNGDYSYPFKNTVQYFSDDEFTIANLECTFSDDSSLRADYTHMFAFKCPTDWINILPAGGVDFVTTANNHTLDFGNQGPVDTAAALESIGMPFGVEDQYQIVETPHGIKLGIYTYGNNCGNDAMPNRDKALYAVQELQKLGADYIICMFHWGLEINYDPLDRQVQLAHDLIDAGADLIYGSHSHCLQPLEEYNDGIILYSMGNWSFGGNTAPTDPDTAIVQITLMRDVDGSVSNYSYNAIPCCVSSNITGALNKYDHYNDFCPTPYEVGSSAYERVFSKLTGTSGLGNPGKDYSSVWASRGG